MPVFNFFRNFFIGGDRGEFGDDWKHNFRNPIWQNDEDDNDDDDFRHIGDNIIGDAMEMAQFFESQFDNMISSIFSNFGDNKILFTPGSIEKSPHEEQSTNSLRDQVLKPGYDFPSEKEQEKSKVDIDLDGKISANNLFKSWDKPENREIVPSVQQFPQSSKVISKRFIRIFGDTIEEHQIIKDGEGNQKEIISKQIGNKKYVISTEKDKNGVETAVNDVINIDKSELGNFQPNQDDSYNNTSNILNYFPWYKFFGPNPKL